MKTSFRTRVSVSCMFLLPLFLPGAAHGAAPAVDSTKAELMGRVEDFFLHNFRDITWRKSLEWGDVQTERSGTRSIRYTYDARIWDRETLTMSQVFTFAEDGKFVGYANADGFPKKEAKTADVSTQKGMIALVEAFFGENFRDITARETIEWGKVAKDANGNASIRYRYRATIRDKDQKVIDQVFTFDPTGKFVSVKDANAESPKANVPAGQSDRPATSQPAGTRSAR